MKNTIQVVATHPNMFELTPQHPAIVDGTSTFQLLLWQGCVRAGKRIKVHVEAASGTGGEQVGATTTTTTTFLVFYGGALTAVTICCCDLEVRDV